MMDHSNHALIQDPAVKLATIKEYLWFNADSDVGVWALLDGQWAPNLAHELINSKLEFCSLFEGPIENERIINSPYLVRLEQDNRLTDWLLSEGWSKGWGVYFQVSGEALSREYPSTNADHIARKRAAGEFFGSDGLEDLEDATILRLRRHFRKFTRVRLFPSDRIVVFRFYDPATLRTYLMNADYYELRQFAGPIRLFIFEDYSEVESLNAPDNMLMFSVSCDEDGTRAKIRAGILDIRLREVRELASSPNYIAPAGSSYQQEVQQLRDETDRGVPYPRIGAHHVEAFQKVEDAKFREQVATGLIECVGDERNINLEEARTISRLEIERGKQHGLTTKTDLINFVICSARHSQFPQKYPIANEALSSAEGGDKFSQERLARLLHRWATQEQREVLE